MTWRVVRQYDEDGVPYHTLEDVIENVHMYPDTLPLVQHVGPIRGITIDDLKDELKSRRRAFDLPVLEYYPIKWVLREAER